MTAQAPNPPSLAHYLRVLRGGAWIILLSLGVTTAAAYYFSSRQEKLYRASADVYLNTQNLAYALSNVTLPSVDPARVVATQADVARTPAVAEGAIRLAKVHGRSADDLLANSSVDTKLDADLLTFSVSDRSPAVASRLTTAYARAYTNYRLAFDTRSIVSARRQVERQLQKMKTTGGGASTTLYATLAEKVQQLRTMELLQGSNAALLRAAGDAHQIQPRPRRNAILGGMLGLVLGIGLVFMRDALNTRVRTAAEIGERLDLPLLARIPEPPRYFRKKNRLLMLEAPLTPEAESYQVLATNLEFVNLDRQAKSILITSAKREEGKSTLAANLAIALARGGKRVVLVDLDLRRPSLSDFFDIAPGLGLTQLLIRRAELGEALVSVPLVEADELQTGHSGGGSLELLPTGSIPPNPAELARSHALGAVLERLEERADLVLIDAPPILGPSDAMTLSAKADALVVVTRLPDLKRPLLDELRRVLDSAPIVKLGFVVTGAPVEGRYGYGYGYAAREGARKTKAGVQSGENE